jgi:hypothetical protein
MGKISLCLIANKKSALSRDSALLLSNHLRHINNELNPSPKQTLDFLWSFSNQIPVLVAVVSFFDYLLAVDHDHGTTLDKLCTTPLSSLLSTIYNWQCYG